MDTGATNGNGRASGTLLEGKKLLITGVITRDSIAYSVARLAIQQGAEVVLTGFGRTRRLTERAARGLPGSPDVLELDVTSDEDIAALAADLEDRWGRLDGLLHAIAYAPEDALGDNFLTTPAASAETAFRVSAFSLKGLGAALAPLLERSERGGSVVGMDFDASFAWPTYNWMGVAKAALESVARYLARDLGPRGVRVNLVSAGPLRTPAASGISGFDDLARTWVQRAPLPWDIDDPDAVAGPVCFLFSDLAEVVSGEIIHVDGGYHAIGTAAGSGVID